MAAAANARTIAPSVMKLVVAVAIPMALVASNETTINAIFCLGASLRRARISWHSPLSPL